MESMPDDATLELDVAHEPDEALMARLAAGDDRPFEILMRRHADRLARFLYRLTGVEAEVEDLVQEVFLRVYRARETFEPGSSFPTWLYAIARNARSNWARGRRRKPLHRAARRQSGPGGSTTLLGKLPAGVTSPSGALAALELAAAIDEALAALPDPYREAVVLCDLERLDYETAAEIAGCPVKTLGSRLARGRERLRAALARDALR